jgi:mono/diheme cytochrome c family protein
MSRGRALPGALSATLLIGLVACDDGGPGGDRLRGGATGVPPRECAPGERDADRRDGRPRMLSIGDSVFHGRRADALCSTCHGEGGKGTDLGPDLTDDEWLNSDGSFGGIVATIRDGVTNPMRYRNSMPASGASLTAAELRAVAAYVYRLRRSSEGAAPGVAGAIRRFAVRRLGRARQRSARRRRSACRTSAQRNSAPVPAGFAAAAPLAAVPPTAGPFPVTGNAGPGGYPPPVLRRPAGVPSALREAGSRDRFEPPRTVPRVVRGQKGRAPPST